MEEWLKELKDKFVTENFKESTLKNLDGLKFNKVIELDR